MTKFFNQGKIRGGKMDHYYTDNFKFGKLPVDLAGQSQEVFHNLVDAEIVKKMVDVVERDRIDATILSLHNAELLNEKDMNQYEKQTKTIELNKEDFDKKIELYTALLEEELDDQTKFFTETLEDKPDSTNFTLGKKFQYLDNEFIIISVTHTSEYIYPSEEFKTKVVSEIGLDQYNLLQIGRNYRYEYAVIAEYFFGGFRTKTFSFDLLDALGIY
jgi:hypothetical protein